MRILTILFVLTIAFSAQAEKKLYVSYLINGTVDSLNVARLSEKLVVEKVVSKTLPTPGGLTSIQVGGNPGEFSVYYNHRPVANGPIKISRVNFEISGNDILIKDTKTLNQRSNSLLNLDINDGIGSVQLTNNTVNRFTLNQNSPQEFKNMKRDVLPGQPYSSSQVRIITPTGTNEYHGSLFFFQRNNALEANVFFRNVIDGNRQLPKLFRFVGPDTPRNMTLLGGCERRFFFGSYERISAQGRSQIGHKRQELNNSDFTSIGSNFTLDQFRDHRNSNLAYFNTLAATLDQRPDGTCRMYSVTDRFNNAKNANEFHGSAFIFSGSSQPRRVVPLKRLNLPIPNNSAVYGADAEVINIDN